MPLERIVSGGQTGVDRGALDAALAIGFPCGGWCPAGRRAEDGPIPAAYPVTALSLRGYEIRTRRNVQDSDATLILYDGVLEGGTALTRRYADELGRPCLCLDAGEMDPVEAARQAAGFVVEWDVRVLNVAGPRGSKWTHGRARAERVVDALIRNAKNNEKGD